MSVSYRETVEQIVSYALDLFEAVESHESRRLAHEQAVLTNGLLNLPGTMSGGSDNLGPRYALACWLDELFIQDSNWSAQWNENKLETQLFGLNDRAWEFWRQAKAAEERADEELLRTLYLCVSLGFRGQLREDPVTLDRWMDRMKIRVTRNATILRSHDGFDVPASAPRVLTGKREWHTAAMVATAVGLLSAPFLSYACLQLLFR